MEAKWILSFHTRIDVVGVRLKKLLQSIRQGRYAVLLERLLARLVRRRGARRRDPF